MNHSFDTSSTVRLMLLHRLSLMRVNYYYGSYIVVTNLYIYNGSKVYIDIVI